MSASSSEFRDHPIHRTLQHLDEDRSVCNAFVDVLHDRALEEASTALSTRSGKDRPLLGVAVGIKELFDVAGADNSYGSATRAGRRSEHDAEIVCRLNRAGAVLVGTTRSHEFGWGITTRRVDGPSTVNPWDATRVAGGSSGGSAAAVARGLVPLAVGSDTGGSIRIPASFCGVLGLKTSWGALSRTGGVALAPSFDTPGFLARTAGMLRSGFVACQGPDLADPATTFQSPGNQRAASHERWIAGAPDGRHALRGLRVGVDMRQVSLGHSDARRSALDGLARDLSDAGAEVRDVDGPDPIAMYETFVPYQMAEAFDVHHRILATFPSMADRYGADVRGRLEAASNVGIGQYLAARRDAVGVIARHHELFSQVDLILRVIGITPPSSIENPDYVAQNGRTIALRDAVMPTTVAENLSGLPSVTFPYGTDDGIPIGMQLTTPARSEMFLIDVLETLEHIGIVSVAAPPTFVH